MYRTLLKPTSLQKTHFWLAKKFLLSRKFLFGGSAPLSMGGLVLGVAALIVSQSVMRGFEVTLKKTMIDLSGDIQVVKTGNLLSRWDDFAGEIKKSHPEVKNLIKFVTAEAVAASNGQVVGVLAQGFPQQEVSNVLQLDRRILSGEFILKSHHAAIGQGLAKRLSLKVGDPVFVAVPLINPFSQDSLGRQSQEFIVSAIVDMGKNDWNERLVLVEVTDLQSLVQIGDRFTGALVKLNNSNQAQKVSRELSENLGVNYHITNWYSVNSNLFEAVELEKIVIFFVVFLIVIIAAFNISSSLYVHVRQRFKDIAVIRALGATDSFVQSLFVWQGFFVATIGVFIGLVIGLMLCALVTYAQSHFPIIAGSVYRIDRIDLSVSIKDFVLIYLATLGACLAASLAPARQSRQLTIIEGLRSD